MHGSLARKVQMMAHDGNVAHSAIGVHVAPRIAEPNFATVDIIGYGWFEVQETTFAAMVALILPISLPGTGSVRDDLVA